MYRQNQTIVNMLEPVISAMGYELWGIEQVPDGRDSLLRIYIDHSEGIDLEDCTRVSRQVVGVLDVEDPISGSYRLEVSSPGLDRPLFSLAQFSRFEGERAQVHLREKLEERRQLKGEIAQVAEDAVTIICEGKQFTVSEKMIDKARLLPF
ncbi:MAG: ribosome maturation factor RimP [Gammaproteobacteria bacterium]|nr:ribosome maturation factor RimP [Gammaproteobacteria bacterium]